MVDILIPREPIPVALTAEQVVASVVEPRTNAEIVRDLLAIVKDRAWQAQAVYRGGGKWITGCEDCGADEENDSTDTHHKGCSTARIIAEAEAFLRVEDALEEERERAESRPAEQVAADIAGPAVGGGGAVCGDPHGQAARRALLRCAFLLRKDSRRREQMDREYVARRWDALAETTEDVAPRAPEEE